MEEFKQVGRYGLAVGLWLGIIWLFSKPKRILLLALAFFVITFGFALLLDDTGALYYVNVNSIELSDKPYGVGKVTKQLIMNDTLRMVGELNDKWVKVALGTDTLYFQNRYIRHDELGFWAQIQTDPFTKNKALAGQEVRLNHPDGYMEIGSSVYKNGDILNVRGYSAYSNSIEIRTGDSNREISIEYIETDWENIEKQYPLAIEN